MKRILASVGIGNASVDTVLPSETVRPGETVDAEVHLEGGDAEQEIGRIEFEIETRYLTEEGYEDTDVSRFSVGDGLTLEPGQSETRDVRIDVPYQTPVTMGGTDVWVETELDISMAVDPEDRDHLDVRPTPRMQALFDGLDRLGFSLRSTECMRDHCGRYTAGDRYLVQEFEFRPQGGPFRGDLDELEVIPKPGPDRLDVVMEVDRRGGVFAEMTDADERHAQFAVDSTDVDAVAERLESTIRKYA